MTAPSDEAASPRTRVLVVDDSAVAREVMRAVLNRDPALEVSTAPNGEIALERVHASRFDVMLLDLEMPGMSGLELLRRVMAEAPMPVVVCTGRADPGAEAVLDALSLGAVEVVYKPSLGVRAMLDDAGSNVVAAVRAAAVSHVRAPAPRRTPKAVPPFPAPPQRAVAGGLVVVGASTGGTEAIRALLADLPPTLSAPVVIVQHMPDQFIPPFAAHLARSTPLPVTVARHGERLLPGRGYVACGPTHLEVVRAGDDLVARSVEGERVSGHRPSVDVLFASAARASGRRTAAALLTGMGEDGARGLLEIRRRGGHTIAQDEATSVVFGMPRAAVALGAAAELLPLPSIAAAIARRARGEGW